MNFTQTSLREFVEAQPVINTHSHQDLSLERGGLDLEKCFRNSYVAWCGVEWEPTPASRAHLLAKIRFNSYFVWLERALQSLYGLDEPLSAENWERLSERMQAAHRQDDDAFLGRCLAGLDPGQPGQQMFVHGNSFSDVALDRTHHPRSPQYMRCGFKTFRRSSPVK